MEEAADDSGLKEAASALRSTNVIARIDPHDAPRKGDKIWLKPKGHAMHFFSASNGRRIEESGELVDSAA